MRASPRWRVGLVYCGGRSYFEGWRVSGSRLRSSATSFLSFDESLSAKPANINATVPRTKPNIPNASMMLP